ncbi:MAG: asparagine synthase (glutamine-hydrolyzing) [Planctomycetota bacterium]|jgi:asparagine synthase (glutamine-hydrolysing)
MCGIAGFWGKDFSPELLGRMGAKISHRGPDDSGTWFSHEYNAGFAHQRLSIIDLSESGKQPMTDSAEKAVITYNGEIYNYRELKEDLASKGYKFNSSSDTEVILNLYLEYGKNFLAKLNGIFSFALFDFSKKEMLLARDGLGVKPLYYSTENNELIFASEIKALTEHKGLSKDININAVKNYITYLYSPAPETILKSVNKLEPGTALLLKDKTISEKWHFYDLPYNEAEKNLTSSPEELAEMLAENLKKAVTRQLVADVPVGAFLSGGLDSSAIAAFAKESISDLKCFTIDFECNSKGWEGFVRDFPYAEKVAEKLAVDLHKITVGPDIANKVKDMVYQLDEPVADPASLNVLFISQLARENNIKVLLSGTGGDDIFTGYRRHYALQNEKYWQWLPVSFRKGISSLSGVFPSGNSFGRRIKKAFAYAGENTDKRIAGYFRWFDTYKIEKLFCNNVKDSAAGYQDPLPEFIKDSRNMSSLDKMLYLEAKGFLCEQNLLYTDKMSMAAGVEVRVPFLDPELISFAATIPDNLKQNGSCSKWLFKKAMEPYLPHEVIYRPKTGFGVPLRHWLHNDLQNDVDNLLSQESIENRGIFDYQEINSLIIDDRAGKEDYTYTIFTLMCIETWMRKFID